MTFFRNNKTKIFVSAFILGSMLLPTVTHAGLCDLIGPTGRIVCGAGDWAVAAVLSDISDLIVKLCAVVLSIAGAGLDFVLNFTVVEMSQRFSSAEGVTAGMGAAISDAWGTIRDLANLAFIFVLLYAAIKVILDLNVASIGNTIKNIVIVGLVINFSMFFTKVVIDVSNIATVGFYNSIQQSIKGSSIQPIPGVNWKLEPGFASAVMNNIGIHTIVGSNALNYLSGSDTNYIIFSKNILGSILMIVLSIVFVIVSVMFISRFVLLILLVVTSAAAAVAYILPGLKKHFDTWKDSLISQAFFAPAFMLMLWISFKMMSAFAIITKDANGKTYEFSNIGGNPLSVIGLLMNYSLVIGFVIASLIIAKQMASKAMGFSAVNSAVGTIGFGAVAATSRNTLGRWGRSAANDKDLLDRAAKGDVVARMQLATANKFVKSSFDARAVGDTKLGKATGAGKLFSDLGKAGGKGGFKAVVDDKAKKKAEYAKNTFGQTDFEKDEAKKLNDTYQAEKLAEENRIRDARTIEARKKTAAATTDEQRREATRFEREVAYKNKNKIYKDEEYSTEFREGTKKAYEGFAKAGERRQVAYADRIEKGPLGIGVIGRMQGNKAAARKIRDQAKGPSKEKKLADAYKEIAGDEIPEPATAPTPPPPPPAGGPTTP
jgi:hypothetical protein